MEKIKEVLYFGYSLLFGTLVKNIFIVFPLVTMDINLTIRILGCIILIYICSVFPIYHIVSIILFTIGANYLYQFSVSFVIVYCILFLLIIIEALRVLITFIILCMSK